jgi:hypothetical protein
MPTPLYGVSWQPSLVAQKKLLWFVRRWCEKLLALFFQKYVSIAKIQENFQSTLFVPRKIKKISHFFVFFTVQCIEYDGK